MIIFDKSLIGTLSVLIAAISYAPYILSTLKGRTKPHVFSWLVWGLATAITFIAQLTDQAGAGAWTTGFSAGCLLLIAGLAFFYGEKNITRSDWISFLATLFAIPLWMLTKDPTLSIIMITLIDSVAYYPTYRKSWGNPWEEMSFKYILTALKHGLSLMAMNNYSLVTILYPAASLFLEIGVVLLLYVRRRKLSVSA